MTSSLPPLVQAVSGSIGSAAANVVSYPLDLVCTRLQISGTKGKQDLKQAAGILRRIVNSRGILGLYNGLQADTAATLLSNFFYFYVYSFLRTRLLRKKAIQASRSATAFTAGEEIVLGFLAGVVSRAISSPFNITAVRLQAERKDKATGEAEGTEEEYADDGTLVGVMKHIYAERGLSGFWKGFETTTLLCLNPSFTFFFYQAFRRIFLRGKDRIQPSPQQAFIGGAVSNVLAVTLLYPLLLAKTRLQSSGRDTQTHSMFDVWNDAIKHGGISGLYQGLEAQLVKGFLNQGLAMMIKQRLEEWIVAFYLYRLRKLTTPMMYRYVYAIFYVD